MRATVPLPRVAAYVAFLLSLTPLSARAVTVQPGTVEQDATNDLHLVAGRSVLLDCAQAVQRVAIGTPTVAEATVISPTEIMVNGKAPGETTLILWESGGSREFFNVEVRANESASVDKLEGIRRQLRTQLAGQQLKVAMENGAIFLSGTVDDLTSSERAVQIASTAGKVVNLLNVKIPDAAPQILLKVVFASVDRSRSKQLGINLFSTGFGNTIGAVSTQQFSAPQVGSNGVASLSNDLNLFAFLPGMNLGGTLQALESKGLVEVLAEPNVLAENGKLGSFLAGGEYPFPVAQGTSGTAGPTITVQFKEYGIRLNFIPTITPRGTIHLQVAPEVSSLDFADAVTVSGFQVPAIAERRVNTEVELSQGQSFAIGGLLDNRETETLQKVPYISNVPVLGKFFQSISRTHNNTELIVIVTPEIVHPAPKGETIATPQYPAPFLPQNSQTPMHTPESGAAEGAQSAPASMPVEKLIESMKPQPALPGESGGMSGAGAVGSGGSK